MASDKSALVLLHGLTMSGESAWREVAPLLANHHQVFIPNALGHRDGPLVQRRPVKVSDVVDAAEQYLDEHGLDRPHLAGNSMGGYMAIELARRGRAATVCALSPGGLLSSEDGARAFKTIQKNLALARLMGPIIPLVVRSASLRRFGNRHLAVHGDRLTPAQTVEIGDDALACTVVDDLAADVWDIAPLNPMPCPITIAWAEKDTLLPLELCRTVARERLPQATFTVLPGVGHAPMVDDPELVARTILAVTGGAKK